MVGFLFGAIAGGIAAYLWRDQIRGYMTEHVPDIRQRAAERLGSIGERAGSALDRVKTEIDRTVRTGQEKIRSVGGEGHESGSHRGAGFTPDTDGGAERGTSDPGPRPTRRAPGNPGL